MGRWILRLWWNWYSTRKNKKVLPKLQNIWGRFSERTVLLCVLSHVWLCSSMDCSPPGSSVHGIFQARILERVSISFSRGYSQPRDRTWVSFVSCIAGGSAEPSGKPKVWKDRLLWRLDENWGAWTSLRWQSVCPLYLSDIQPLHTKTATVVIKIMKYFCGQW